MEFWAMVLVVLYGMHRLDGWMINHNAIIRIRNANRPRVIILKKPPIKYLTYKIWGGTLTLYLLRAQGQGGIHEL